MTKNMKKIIVKIAKWISVILIIPGYVIISTYIDSRFKGEVEKIVINSNIALEGVLIKPRINEPHPVVLLLHGAGNNQPYDKLYFRFHANAFLEQGFAVLIYSKRSSKEVDYQYFTYEDLLNDAQSAIDFLKNRTDIDQKKIGVMAVSESGWFSPELVHANPQIAFLINRVSSPLSVLKTVSHEIRSDAIAEGFSEEEVERVILPVHKRIWEFYIDVNNGKQPPNGTEKKLIDDTLSELYRDEKFGAWFNFNELGSYDTLLYNSLAKRYSYNPMPFFEKIDVPMLYILAGKDKNIPTKEVISVLENAKMNDRKDITIKVYQEATHYLYKFGLNDGPFEGLMYYDDYLNFITDWASKQIK